MSQSLPVIAANESSKSTAEVILDTAERLFADEGIDNVSIRQILIASGHANQSGARYHFGSRETLIRTLLTRRMEVVNAMRNASLDRLVADGGATDIGAIVRTTVHNLARVVKDFPWGRDYLLIIAQALFNTRLQLETTMDQDALSGYIRMANMVKPLLSHLPKDERELRIQMLRHDTIYALARWLQEHGTVTRHNAKNFDMTTERIIAFVVAGMLAPAA